VLLVTVVCTLALILLLLVLCGLDRFYRTLLQPELLSVMVVLLVPTANAIISSTIAVLSYKYCYH
jgi:hypothetical protein